MSLANGFTLCCVSLGVFFFFAGWLGLMRFPDALSRLHALSKADNLGLGLVVIGLLPQASWPFGVFKLIALWVLAMLIGGATGLMLASAIHARVDKEPDGNWVKSVTNAAGQEANLDAG